MRTLVVKCAGLLLLVVMTLGATSFESSRQFSSRKNPARNWQYGYSMTHSLDPEQFRLDKSTGVLGAISFWHPRVSGRPGPGYYPYVAHNNSNRTQPGSSNGWAARAGELAMEASNSGQFAIVRFVAPANGTYRVTAHFAGVHYGLSTTDVHVLHNRTSLFEAEIDGYGGDPAFHKIQGTNPAADFSDKVEMKAKDIVTFAIGYGSNHTNYGDTTGLFATVVLLDGR